MKISDFEVFHISEVIPEMSGQFHEAYWSGKPVLLLINSIGGDFEIGFNISATIKLNGKVHGLVTGICESIAVLILQSCKTRYIFPGGRLYFHPCSFSPEIDVLEYADRKVIPYHRRAYNMQVKFEEMVAERSGREPRAIRLLCQEKKYLSAAEAIEMNLVDTIWDPEI